jgi:hypothetical protein
MKCTRRNFLLGLTALPAITVGLNTSRAESLTVKLPIPVSPSTSVDLALLLKCIAQVESGTLEHPEGDDSRVGPKGERSKYQIKQIVWDQHFKYCRGPIFFRECCSGETANVVALKHIRWLDSSLPRTTPIEKGFREYALAWCWHGGLSSWKEAGPEYEFWKQPAKLRIRLNNYATRVTNLYVELKNKRSV